MPPIEDARRLNLRPTDQKTRPTSLDLAWSVLSQDPGAIIEDIELARSALGPQAFPDQIEDWLNSSVHHLKIRATEQKLVLYSLTHPPNQLHYTLRLPQKRGAIINDQPMMKRLLAVSPLAYHQPILNVNAARVIGPDQAIFGYPDYCRQLINYLAGKPDNTGQLETVFLNRSNSNRVRLFHAANATLITNGNPLRGYMINRSSRLIMRLNPGDRPLDIPYPFPGLDQLPDEIRRQITQTVRLTSDGRERLNCHLTLDQLDILSQLIHGHNGNYHSAEQLKISAGIYKEQIRLMRRILGEAIFQAAPGGYHAYRLSSPEHKRGAAALDDQLTRLVDLPRNSGIGARPLEALRLLDNHRSSPVSDTELLTKLEQWCGHDISPRTLKQYIVSLRPYLRPPFDFYRDLFLRGYLLHDTTRPLTAKDLLPARLPDWRKLPENLVDFLLWIHTPIEFSPKGIINRLTPHELTVLHFLLAHRNQTLTYEQIFAKLSQNNTQANRSKISHTVINFTSQISSVISAGPFRNLVRIRNERDTGYYLEFFP